MLINRSSITICLLVLLAGASGAALSLSGLYLYISPKLPAVETLREFKYETPLRVYSSDNQLIGEIGEKRSIPIRFEDAPPNLIKAFLAAEDSRFYSHSGVDIRGTLRAVSQFLQPSDVQTGGSTITQQVAKLFFLTPEKTIIRKLNEWFLAVKIENELEKDEIFELYINKIYLGNRAYGVRAAAQVYYGKNVEDLKVAEFAMLAGTPQRPSFVNPIINPERSMQRRDWILSRMRTLGYIDEETYQTAVATPNTAAYHSTLLDLNAPYITEMARKHMYDLYGEAAYSDGYRVYTTVDSKLQAAAQRSVVKGLLEYDWRHGYRGPEQRLKPKFFDPQSASDESQVPQFLFPAPDQETAERNELLSLSPESNAKGRQLNLEVWMKELSAIPTYADLHPAAVVFAQEKTLKALLKNGVVIDIPWENGPSSARPYVTVNRRDPAPKDTTFLKLGDVIRVRQLAEGEWQLSQVPAAQGALVALDPSNGAVRALIGGFDFNHSHYNRAIQAERPPGSNFKPFIYAAALENGFTAATIVNDSPWSVFDKTLEGTWRPQNSDQKYLGPIRFREALYRSRNLASVRILDTLGGAKATARMDRFGFDKSRLPRNDLSLALGTYSFKPIQIANAYAVFANGGYKVENYFIDRIEDVNGEVIFQARPLTVCEGCVQTAGELVADESASSTRNNNEEAAQTKSEQELAVLEAQLAEQFNSLFNQDDLANLSPEELEAKVEQEVEQHLETLPPAPRVMDPQVAYIMDSILRDVITRGTGTRARRELQRSDLAGKTGTTDDGADAWFSGYTPDLVATTWMGFDQNTSLGASEFGASAALPIWIEFMSAALADMPEHPRELPAGLVSIRINPKTGKRAAANDPNAVFEWFRPQHIPEWDTEMSPQESSSGEEEVHPDELF